MKTPYAVTKDYKVMLKNSDFDRLIAKVFAEQGRIPEVDIHK